VSPTADRRRWIRHAPDAATVCDVTIPGVATVRAPRVGNVSVGGAEVEMDVAIQPGERVDLEFAHPPSGASVRRVARVVYCIRLPGGNHRLGAAFGTELTAPEVEALC
jgi:hypothetical protein